VELGIGMASNLSDKCVPGRLVKRLFFFELHAKKADAFEVEWTEFSMSEALSMPLALLKGGAEW